MTEERQQAIAADKERSYQAFQAFGIPALKSYFRNKLKKLISYENASDNIGVLLDRQNAVDAIALLDDGAHAIISKVCFKPNLRQFQIRYSRPNGLPTEFFKLTNEDNGTRPDYVIQTITKPDSDYACIGIVNRRDFLYAVRRGYATIQEHPDKSKSINVPFSCVKSCKSFFTVLQEAAPSTTNKTEESAN